MDLIKILKYINPAQCNYQEWCNVGMALKHEGYTASDWEAWSRQDISRYHMGECEKKWQTFNGSAAPVTAGTIVQMAKDNGWSPESGLSALEWDSVISRDDYSVIDTNWIEDSEISFPNLNPAEQLTKYLQTLFEASDTIGYVTKCWLNEDGKFLPTKGVYKRTAGEIIRELSKCGGDIGQAIGDYNQLAGAWIRFNPLDGNGVKNENVTEYRYALVESDENDIAKQNAIIKELELPVACLVYSGKKSLHAIVRIDAPNYEEYKKRVDFLYKVCQKNGMKIDIQNRNPSRLSRMPGVMRGGVQQCLLETNIGQPSWDAWREWIEGINDDLPDIETVADVFNDIPPLSPPLIENILRQGHKMLLAGPSKAGKSFALIELCIAIAEGTSWLGYKCAKGRVLYVNLELDRASCLHRFADVYKATDTTPNNICNIDIWNLRGKSVAMDKLTPKLIRRAQKKSYIAVIIDPIYKIITGDENSASDMAKFCNQFDKVCSELKCAVIYCHHHSKGAQGGKKSMHRASGSGVFARDPDALLDMVELELTDSVISQKQSQAACKAYLQYIDNVSRDDACSERTLSDIAKETFPDGKYDMIMQDVNSAKEAAKALTAWRIEATLREFPKSLPVNMWFEYPVHRIDNTGILGDMSPDTALEKAWQSRKSGAKKTREDINEQLEIAYAALSIDGDVTVKKLCDYWSMTEKGVWKRIDGSKNFYRKNGIVYRFNEGNSI